MKLVSEQGRDLIEKWIDGVPVGDRGGVRIELKAWLKAHKNLRADFWGRPQFSWLKGDKLKGIGEIIFSYRNVEYRVLGCFGPESDQFTMLIGATKSRKKKRRVHWSPEDAPGTANDRRKWLSDERRYKLNELEVY